MLLSGKKSDQFFGTIIENSTLGTLESTITNSIWNSMKILSNCFTALIIVLWLVTCSVSKEGRIIKKAINGSWVLQTVTTEGITGSFKSRIFNEADFSCFIGSEWNFSKKGTGSYAIVDLTKECPPVRRSITWSVDEIKDGVKQFSFKRFDDKKVRMDEEAFKVIITQLDARLMKLRSDIIYDGHPAAMIFNFVKK
jgi:hypothetical protein